MTPRHRVIVDNDFAGDPDDLFQLAHHVLSPSVEIPFVIGSHLAPGDFFDPSDAQADNGARVARDLLALIGADIPVLAGSNTGLDDRRVAKVSMASRAIVREALRDDERPLFVALGGGMTELASALLVEPRIAERITVVWIGGPEHADLGGPAFPAADRIEYNLNIDIRSAQVVFDSGATIWQVPRDAYRQALVSYAELDERVRPHGALGRRLADSISDLVGFAEEAGVSMGETYDLGDQPLVLLTALQSAFEPDTSTSEWVVMPAPHITDVGGYEPNEHGAPMRVYTRLDTRMMFDDLFAKLARWSREHA